MKRLLHIGLLLMALLDLMNQSTAMAMVPARITAASAHGPRNAQHPWDSPRPPRNVRPIQVAKAANQYL